MGFELKDIYDTRTEITRSILLTIARASEKTIVSSVPGAQFS